MKLINVCQFVIFVVHPASFQLLQCDLTQQVHIASAVAEVSGDGSLKVAGGLVYPPGAFHADKHGFTGCPCTFMKCMAHCSNVEIANASKEHLLRSGALPGWHHFHKHHHKLKLQNVSGEYSKINLDNETKNFFDIFYPMDGPDDHGESFDVFYNSSELEEFPLQDILDSLDEFCFAVQNQSLLVLRKYEEDFLEVTLCFIISVACLAMLIVAFVISKETRYDHGKSVVCQSICLLVAFLGLCLDHSSMFEIDTKECQILGYVTYYFTMSSFFWLNAMCFDMFWTFCSEAGRGKGRFRAYLVYAWICPLMMTLGIVLPATAYAHKESKWTTGIGSWACFIGGDSKEGPLIYLFGPLLLLLLLNLFFFVATMVQLCRTQKMLGQMLKIGNTNSKKIENERKFLVYVKLFAVMGGFWIMEFFSWALDGKGGVWRVFDVLNSLRGLWMLVFCVLLSRRVRTRLVRNLAGGSGLQRGNTFSNSSSNQATELTTRPSIRRQRSTARL